MADTLQLNLSLLVPTIRADDACMTRLTSSLDHHRGIEQAHIVQEGDEARLCLHYDPNLLTLGQLQRLAQEAGAQLSDRYRHEQLAFAGLDAADSAEVLAAELNRLPGMLHAQVNYAAGLISLAYDTTKLQRPAIAQVVRRMGARVLSNQTARSEHRHTEEKHDTHDDHAGHNHGSAPTFLPHWMQERWALLLVGLAGLFLAVGWVGETFLGLPAQVALVFYLLAYVAGGYDVATHAIPGLLRGKFDTDVLMLAAALGAALLGEWVEGAFLLFLFALGHAGEHYALDRARSAVNALGELMPQVAQLRRGEQIVATPIGELAVGDVVVVRPGDRIPVDGSVTSGSTSVDQAPITGESTPVAKQAGDRVFAGTINQTGAVDVQVETLAQDSTLSRVMQLVAEAQSQQSPTQQFTQRFSAWFVPTVLVATALVAVVPWALGWMPWSDSFYRAMTMLVAASPCALAIGTPATVLAGIAQAARNGVLIKGGAHLENLGRISALAFDKTGTITQGRFSVVEFLPAPGIEQEHLLTVAAAVEQQSNHPLAQAVVRAAEDRPLPAAGPLTNRPGLGVESTIGGEAVQIGTAALMAEAGVQIDPAISQQLEAQKAKGRSTMLVAQGGNLLGGLALADTPRPQARATMQQLRSLGIERLVMLTGDAAPVAQQIGRDTGLSDIRAELLPEDKLKAIGELGQQAGGVAMVGDGVNDAPALAAATVGIAMGGAGTAVALETADIALMADDLGKLPFAVGLSRASAGIIRQNLGISLGVIGLLLISSVVGLVPLGIAVILHEGSTIVVVLNALRLLRYQLRSAA